MPPAFPRRPSRSELFFLLEPDFPDFPPFRPSRSEFFLEPDFPDLPPSAEPLYFLDDDDEKDDDFDSLSRLLSRDEDALFLDIFLSELPLPLLSFELVGDSASGASSRPSTMVGETVASVGFKEGARVGDAVGFCTGEGFGARVGLLRSGGEGFGGSVGSATGALSVGADVGVAVGMGVSTRFSKSLGEGAGLGGRVGVAPTAGLGATGASVDAGFGGRVGVAPTTAGLGATGASVDEGLGGRVGVASPVAGLGAAGAAGLGASWRCRAYIICTYR